MADPVSPGTTTETFFGATGDGRKPVDSHALQAAIDAGCEIRIPCGLFRFDETIELQEGTVLTGSGPASVLEYSGRCAAISDRAQGPATSATLPRFTLRGMRLPHPAPPPVCADPNDPPEARVGIQVRNAYTLTCDDITIDGSPYA